MVGLGSLFPFEMPQAPRSQHSRHTQDVVQLKPRLSHQEVVLLLQKELDAQISEAKEALAWDSHLRTKVQMLLKETSRDHDATRNWQNVFRDRWARAMLFLPEETVTTYASRAG